MKIFLIILSCCFLFTNCGCPKTCKQVPIKEEDYLGFPNLSTVPPFPKNYPTHKEWDKIRQDLHPEEPPEQID